MMSKRSEIHSSNIIGKRQGILRFGREYKSKGRGIVPGFRKLNVSFADEDDNDNSDLNECDQEVMVKM